MLTAAIFITMNEISLISKIYFLQYLFFQNYLLVKVNTNNTARSGVNKQNTHTHLKHSEKDNTGNG